MSEGERIGAWLALLTLVGIGGLCYNQIIQNERMAKAGYIAYRLVGSTEVYWSPPAEPEFKRLGPSKF